MKTIIRAACTLLLATATACGQDSGEPEALPPEMPVLLHQAWESTVHEHGAAEAEARFAPVQERSTALRTALRSRDLPRVRGAQEALRAEQVHFIATALGADGPRQVLDAVANLVRDLEDRVQAAAAEGRDVTRVRSAVDEAEALHADATAALARNDYELALEIALRAVDHVTTARVAARSL